MKRTMRRTLPGPALPAAMLLAVAGLGACGSAATAPGVPNPASVHCAERGGRLVIERKADGGAVGICVFGNGRRCEEWAFYRGECHPGPDPAPEKDAGQGRSQ